jgi:hypothetical protein
MGDICLDGGIDQIERTVQVNGLKVAVTLGRGSCGDHGVYPGARRRERGVIGEVAVDPLRTGRYQAIGGRSQAHWGQFNRRRWITHQYSYIFFLFQQAAGNASAYCPCGANYENHGYPPC